MRIEIVHCGEAEHGARDRRVFEAAAQRSWQELHHDRRRRCDVALRACASASRACRL